MLYFCTYFDSNYLIRGLTLYRSLIRHVAPFRLWVLCFDDLTYEVLQKLALPEVVPISLRNFEEGDEQLLKAKSNRSRVEYYFTCTPSLPLYILRNCPEVDVVTYLDADLFFFSDPSPIYEELGDDSILVVGHRFPPHLKDHERFGIYNVGLLSFRRDNNGLKCLNWWRERCIEWCYDREEDGRFADQKYLDDWPVRFQRVVVLQHKGAGLAPWNWMSYRIRVQNGHTTIDGHPLIFYHFHNLKILNRWLCDPRLSNYRYSPMPMVLRRWLYVPYMRSQRETWRWIRRIVPEVDPGYTNLRTGLDGRRTVVKRLLCGQLLVAIGPFVF
jgi:hypothetical protein